MQEDRPKHPPILIYHAIDYLHAQGGPSGREMFTRQMRYLADHGYRPLTPAQFIDALDGRIAPHRKSVLLTFDDGYSDFYEDAFPVLAELSFPATVFVVTGTLDGMVDSWRGLHADPIPRFLSWPQIEEMIQAGMSFESHGHTHARMDEMSPSDAVDEVTTSKKILEDRLGKPATLFAYPYGSFNAEAKEAVRDAGYAAGLAWVSKGLDRFELRRRAIPSARSIAPFPLRLSRAYPVLRVAGRHNWMRAAHITRTVD